MTEDANTVRLEYERPPLYPKQYAALFDPHRYSITEASTKSGKTAGAIIWLIEQALGGRPGWNYWWVAPVSAQADIAFRRTIRALPADMRSYNLTVKTVTLVNGCILWFKSGDHPDSLYGEDVYAAVIDEASRCKDEVFHAVRSTLTATQGQIRIIGNVKGRKNWFYALARKAEMGDPNMGYHKIVAADAVAANVLEEEEIADAKAILPEAVFKELYLAEASDDEGNPFGLKAIAACIAPLSSKLPRVWGWDLAKSVDWTVGIALDEDGAVCRFYRWQRPWVETIRDIKLATGHGKALVDSTGVGDPVLEHLQRDGGTNYEGYHFTGPSKQKLMEGLAVKIQSGAIKFPEGIIRKELEVFEYQYTRTGVRYSVPEDMGYHDDCVCALALACMHQLTARIVPKISAGVMERAGIKVRGMGVRIP